MRTGILKDMVEVIKGEQLRREAKTEEVDPSYGYDLWQFTELPFVNELYLMIMFALHHQVERELIKIAAKVGHPVGKEMSAIEYISALQQERESLRHGDGWKCLSAKLKLQHDFESDCMNILRLLANSYKHDPYLEPDKELLKLLKAKTDVKYDTLPESNALREKLATFVGLEKDVSYCYIAERFIEIADQYLKAVESRLVLSQIKPRHVSLLPKDFLH